MNLLSPTIIKELLSNHNAKPSKRMGQNFLIDNRILDKIVDAAELSPTDTILEVGPGIGILTQALAQKTQKVIAVEKDRVMVAILKETLHDFLNIQIIRDNALTWNVAMNEDYKVVANIPYYLTSAIIRKFLEETHQPKSMVLMIQKEVAQRICAKPPEMSLLAASVQFYATPTIISYVSKNCFWPSPNVDSAIIKIVPHDHYKDIDPTLFFTIVKAGFSHPRKQLLNNFSTSLKKDRESISLWLSKNNITPNQRAETLTLADWVCLTQSSPL